MLHEQMVTARAMNTGFGTRAQPLHTCQAGAGGASVLVPELANKLSVQSDCAPGKAAFAGACAS